MKKLKVIVSIICFFFYITAFLHAVDFKTQTDVDNPANWAALNADTAGIFYGDFFLSTSVALQSGGKLSTNNSNIIRTLTANKNNNFFSLPENSLNTSLTIDGLVLKGGTYKGSSFRGGAAICVPGENFTLNGNASFIQNTASEGSGGAVFLSSGTLTFTDNVIFKENVALSGVGGAIYCSSGSVVFNSYVVAESNEASLGGAVYSNDVSLNDGGYFVNNKASRLGGAIFLNGGSISTFKAVTKDMSFSGNTMQNELGAYIRNDIYIQGGNTLIFDAAVSRTITLDGGILCDNSDSIVNKTGKGTLVFNGDFDLRTFNVYEGVMNFGDGSTFYAREVYFATGVFINMRTQSSNELKFFNLTSSASICYDINLENKFSDKIIIENRAQMDGSKIKAVFSGVYSGSVTYNIIVATSVGGSGGSGSISFDNTNSEGCFMTRVHSAIDYGVSGNPNLWHEVNLTLQVDQLSSVDGLSDNERSVAFALDSDYGDAVGDLFFIIDTIDKIDPHYKDNIVNIKAALNDLSGYVYANAITVPALNAVRNNILSRLERNYFSNDGALSKRNIWGHWYSANNLCKGDNNSQDDFKSYQKGFQVGFDTLKEDAHVFGITVGSVDSNSSQNDDKVDINGYNVGCYGSYFFDNNLETRVLLIGGRDKYTSKRNVKFLKRKTGAEFAGYNVNAAAELAYNHYYNNTLCIKPFVSLFYSYVHTDDFIEKGANAADLNVFSNSYNMAETLFGLRVNNGIESKFKWQAELKAYLFLYGRTGDVKAKLKNGLQEMNIKGLENDLFNVIFGLGIIYDITKYLGVYANLNSIVSDLDIKRGFYCNVGANFKFNILQKDFYEKKISN
ncbi:MAG: autotransporter domain-containing protein [Endomicrobium sp.]|jgi:outer membrane autotransporter protein|nr:autotransporter domain-containing protein [Endomicrobium sp.]